MPGDLKHDGSDAGSDGAVANISIEACVHYEGVSADSPNGHDATGKNISIEGCTVAAVRSRPVSTPLLGTSNISIEACVYSLRWLIQCGTHHMTDAECDLPPNASGRREVPVGTDRISEQGDTAPLEHLDRGVCPPSRGQRGLATRSVASPK